MLHDIPPAVYTDIREFRPLLKQAAENRNIKLYASMRDAIYDALGEKDPDAAVEVDRQGPARARQRPARLRERAADRGCVRLFRAEVQPYVPDVWVDEDYVDEQDAGVGRVGYEINEYEPPRPLEEIEADIAALEREILDMLGEVAG